MMEHIRPTQSQKNRMLENAVTPKTVRKTFKKRYCILAVAVAMLIPTTVFASEIKSAIYRIFTENKIVSDDVLNEIYTDSDGHITMTVKELLSDKINAYAVVEYIAHDEKGREWLGKYEPFGSISKTLTLTVEPDIRHDNTMNYGVNYSFWTDELMEYNSADKRVFVLEYNASGDNFGTDCVKLSYDMVNRDKTTSINVNDSVEVREISLDNSSAPERTYKPIGIKLSTLGFMIYGENHGNYEVTKSNLGTCIRAISDEEIDSLYMIMKDGTVHDLLNMSDNQTFEEWASVGGGGSMLTSVQNTEVDYDISIYCGAFRETMMDIDTIAGFKLDGVYYSVEQ